MAKIYADAGCAHYYMYDSTMYVCTVHSTTELPTYLVQDSVGLPENVSSLLCMMRVQTIL